MRALDDWRFCTPAMRWGSGCLARLAAVVCLIAAALLASVPAHAAVRALVIGIDKYPNLAAKYQLAGAVNDARDISAVLRKSGAEVTTIVDLEATKAHIESTWRKLVEISKPGDTLLFTYAGHGFNEDDENGDEKDGKDENFVLSGFGTSPDQKKERIVDDEMNAWLKLADDKGVRVIFVADSCFSGTMTRALSAPVGYRFLNIPPISSGDLELPPVEVAKKRPEDFNDVTFIAATVESRVIPEIRIGNQTRGALSYSFARALEKGGADADDDGQITQSELLNFVLPKVQELVEGQQSPQVLPLRVGNRALIVRQVAVEPKPTPVDADVLRLAVVGGDPSAIAGMNGIAIVSDPKQANAVWYVDRGIVEHVPGGRVAENVNQRSIVAVLAKLSTLHWLEVHANGKPARFILHSGNQRYKPGEIINLSFEGAALPYLTLFNLAPNGRVEFFVNDDEVNIDWRGKTAKWQFRPDKPPFGAEHMVAILTGDPLVELHRGLKSMSSAASAVGLRDFVVRLLKGREFQFAKVGIYTGVGK